MATLIMRAKLKDIDPQAWLADVLANKLEQFLPWKALDCKKAAKLQSHIEDH